MRRLFLLLLFFSSTMVMQAQNVGIGILNPADLLHINDGHLRLSGNDKYFKFYANSPGLSAIQFFSNRNLSSNIYYEPVSQQLNIAKDLNGNGLVYEPFNNRLFLGRNFAIGDEVFGVRANTTAFGGMYMETTDLNGSPFYGYATNGASRMYHYYNGNNGDWVIHNGGTDQLFLKPDGKLTVGRNFTIGSEYFGVRANTTEYGGMYMETTDLNGSPFYGYATNGMARMWHYYDHTNNALKFNFNAGDIFTFKNTGMLGIGTIDPMAHLHVKGNIRIDNLGSILQFYDNATNKAFIQHDGSLMAINNLTNTPMYFYTNNMAHMVLKETGELGIGTSNPITNLHVVGDQWDLAGTDGIMALGSDTERMAFGVAIGEAGAGTGRIYSKGTTNKLILGGGTNDVLSVLGNKRVGIGTNNPATTLDVVGEEVRTVQISNDYGGTASKFGVDITAEDTGTGARTALITTAVGNGSLTTGTVAGRFIANGNGSSGNVFGLNVSVSSSGTGDHYGIYTTAATAPPSPSTRSWSLFAQGHSYFDRVMIGTLDGATDYQLSVDGRIMSEELKVQLSTSWPDYVFAEGYQMMSLEEIEKFIDENQHLPGVPSAMDVEKEKGFHVGEMNRILLEKVEELTLLLIEQDKKMKKLEVEIQSLKKN